MKRDTLSSRDTRICFPFLISGHEQWHAADAQVKQLPSQELTNLSGRLQNKYNLLRGSRMIWEHACVGHSSAHYNTTWWFLPHAAFLNSRRSLPAVRKRMRRKMNLSRRRLQCGDAFHKSAKGSVYSCCCCMSTTTVSEQMCRIERKAFIGAVGTSWHHLVPVKASGHVTALNCCIWFSV